MKLSTLFVSVASVVLVNAPVALPVISNFIGESAAQAGQTCTTDGKTWECTEDDTSTQPDCVGKGPFECSEPAPAGLTSSRQDNQVLALVCGANEKLVTDEKGKEYCQSTDIGG